MEKSSQPTRQEGEREYDRLAETRSSIRRLLRGNSNPALIIQFVEVEAKSELKAYGHAPRVRSRRFFPSSGQGLGSEKLDQAAAFVEENRDEGVD